MSAISKREKFLLLHNCFFSNADKFIYSQAGFTFLVNHFYPVENSTFLIHNKYKNKWEKEQF